jgi:hypothetical protein
MSFLFALVFPPQSKTRRLLKGRIREHNRIIDFMWVLSWMFPFWIVSIVGMLLSPTLTPNVIWSFPG